MTRWRTLLAATLSALLFTLLAAAALPAGAAPTAETVTRRVTLQRGEEYRETVSAWDQVAGFYYDVSLPAGSLLVARVRTGPEPCLWKACFRDPSGPLLGNCGTDSPPIAPDSWSPLMQQACPSGRMYFKLEMGGVRFRRHSSPAGDCVPDGHARRRDAYPHTPGHGHAYAVARAPARDPVLGR